jgi:AcrR family transcriptional regulator
LNLRRKASLTSTASTAPDGAAGAQRIRRAGIELFSRYGYHGTSMRALADAVNLEAASIYHHFPSKQDILADIFDRTMDELLDGMQRALGGAGSHRDRLVALVHFHVLYHVDRQREAFISHSELRSLTPANLTRINARRDDYERRLRSFLQSGVDAGEFAIKDVPIMTIVILMMCSGVSDWFADQGRLSGSQIAEEYTRLVLHLVRSGGNDSHPQASGAGSGAAAGSRPAGRPGRRARQQSLWRHGQRPAPEIEEFPSMTQHRQGGS